MKNTLLFIMLNLGTISMVYSQPGPESQGQKAIHSLIDQYSQARETRDTALLKKILTIDVDQLVSTGEWRSGISEAVAGMLKSSASSPGTRTLQVDKIKMLNETSAIVDCKYEIQNQDGTKRKMWSSFVVVAQDHIWKITAIRNMLPVAN
jgi:uncharacterized protein (TIGR02246 family)